MLPLPLTGRGMASGLILPPPYLSSPPEDEASCTRCQASGEKLGTSGSAPAAAVPRNGDSCAARRGDGAGNTKPASPLPPPGDNPPPGQNPAPGDNPRPDGSPPPPQTTAEDGRLWPSNDTRCRFCAGGSGSGSRPSCDECRTSGGPEAIARAAAVAVIDPCRSSGCRPPPPCSNPVHSGTHPGPASAPKPPPLPPPSPPPSTVPAP